MKKSFTLIELLIVIGILAILVVTILITLNPSEAQKKARDVKRMKDLATLQSIIVQYINDGNTPICSPSACGSGWNNKGSSQPCDSSWINTGGGSVGNNINLCNYAKTIPADPRDGQNGTVVYQGTVQNPTMLVLSTTSLGYFSYYLHMSGSDYKIGVLQESRANAGNLTHDTSGNITSPWVTASSGPTGDSL